MFQAARWKIPVMTREFGAVTPHPAVRSSMLTLVVLILAQHASAGASEPLNGRPFPSVLSDYSAAAAASLGRVLAERVRAEPFNLIATIIFLLAIVHTFMAPVFLRLAHRFEKAHRPNLDPANQEVLEEALDQVSFKAKAFHFLGEIEAVFGSWVIPLMVAMTLSKGWATARGYVGHGLDFTEPLFVVVIMTIAASRPILNLSERLLALGARLGRSSCTAWWFSILTIGPLLGSLITEPAAMTISAPSARAAETGTGLTSAPSTSQRSPIRTGAKMPGSA